MAVKVANKRGGILSNLGTLAQLGGMAIPGAGWLTPLGMGMKAADSLMNGADGQEAVDALGTLKDTISGWKNPASGSIAKSASKASDIAKSIGSLADKDDNDTDYERLSRKWRRSGIWQH